MKHLIAFWSDQGTIIGDWTEILPKDINDDQEPVASFEIPQGAIMVTLRIQYSTGAF